MCGNLFSNTSINQVDKTMCNITCPGNSDQMCGGFIEPTNYVNVYFTNYSKKI
jgi:hypothetical protein